MKLLFTIFLLVLAGSLYSQQWFPSTSYTKGSVIDDSTGKKIAFVHIYNESWRTGYIADEYGNFRIPADEGDTLVLSAIGYYSKVIMVNDSSFSNVYKVRLLPQIYEIDEVSIRTFRSYHDFKLQFLSLKLPETETTRLRENLAVLSHRIAVETATNKKNEEILGRSNTDFFTVGIPILSKEDKQRLNYVEVLKKEERQRVIEKKYNRDIIYQVTQQSEDEITEFMEFCNFSEEFLYNTSPYEILLAIEKKFKEFKLMKESGNLIFEKDEIPEQALS